MVRYAGCYCFLHQLQLASHELAVIWQKKIQKKLKFKSTVAGDISGHSGALFWAQTILRPRDNLYSIYSKYYWKIGFIYLHVCNKDKMLIKGLEVIVFFKLRAVSLLSF